MKIVVTLEADVARRLQQEIRQTGKGMKAVVNEALRTGIGLAERREKPPPFKVQPHSFGFKPGVDLDRLNQLVDELEAEGVARKLGR